MSFARCPDTYLPLDPGATTTHTGRPLPTGWSESVTLCVAIAGARASGKSLYTAVMVKQLELLGKYFQKSVQAADSSTAQRYRTYYETPLFEEMKQMSSTPTSANPDAYQRDPFIFSLGEWVAEDGVVRPHYLVFRDVAGEDLENPNPDHEALSFFAEADLVIFLFDPLNVPAISNYLQGLIPVHGALGAQPKDVLRNLLDILGDKRPTLAVTISKFDTLQKLAELEGSEWREIMGNEGAAFRRDTGWDYDTNTQLLLHWEIQSLLMRMDADSLTAMIDQYYPAGGWVYCATSSLGESPNGEDLDRKGIAPYRCLDPLRFLFYNRKIFT